MSFQVFWTELSKGGKAQTKGGGELFFSVQKKGNDERLHIKSQKSKNHSYKILKKTAQEYFNNPTNNNHGWFNTVFKYINGKLSSPSQPNNSGTPKQLMTRAELCVAMDALAVRRPIFHSEADFQFELAWNLAEAGSRYRAEVPHDLGGDVIYLDLSTKSGAPGVGIELKYLKSLPNAAGVAGKDRYEETFNVKNNSSTNLARYDIWSDYSRLSQLVHKGALRKGYVIVLTNDSNLWAPPGEIMGRNFPLQDGSPVTTPMDWHWNGHTEEEKRRTVGGAGRMTPITLPILPKELKWEEYTKQFNDPSPLIGVLGHFRYLIIETP